MDFVVFTLFSGKYLYSIQADDKDHAIRKFSKKINQKQKNFHSNYRIERVVMI